MFTCCMVIPIASPLTRLVLNLEDLIGVVSTQYSLPYSAV